MISHQDQAFSPHPQIARETLKCILWLSLSLLPPPPPPIPTVSTPLASVFLLGAPECRRVISPLFLGHNEAGEFGRPLPTAHRAGGLGGRTRWHVQCAPGPRSLGDRAGAQGLVCSCFPKECAQARVFTVPTQCLHFFPGRAIFPVKRPLSRSPGGSSSPRRRYLPP